MPVGLGSNLKFGFTSSRDDRTLVRVSKVTEIYFFFFLLFWWA